MGKISSISGALIFLSSYVLLYFGLYGLLVEYQFSVQPEKGWFKDSPHHSEFDMVFSMIKLPPITVIPKTSRSLLGHGGGGGGKGSAQKAPSSMLEAHQVLDLPPVLHASRTAQGLARREGSHRRLAPLGVLGEQQALVELEAEPGTPPESHSLIEFLVDEARAGHIGYFAPVAMIFFGIALPLMKLVLVVCFMLSSAGSDGSGKLAAASLHAASVLSRWAAVDAVAEAGLVALLLEAGMFAKHDFGYTTFISYVFLSGFGTWLMLPDGLRRPFCLEQVLPGHRRLACILLPVTTILFAVLLGLGAFWVPLAAMRATISQESLEKKVNAYVEEHGGPMLSMGKAMLGAGQFEAMIAEFATKLPKLSAELSVGGMIHKLVSSGHIHTVAGSIALFVGVLFMPAVEAVLGLAVVMVSTLSGTAALDRQAGVLFYLQSCADFAAEFSLLDVFVVGMAACVQVMNSFSSLRLDLMPGFFYLVGAAVIGLLNKYLTVIVTAPSELEMRGELGLPGPAKSCFEDMKLKH